MPDNNAIQNKDSKDNAALDPKATQSLSDVQVVVFGDGNVNGKSQTELLRDLIVPVGRSFDVPPEVVVDEKTGRTEVLDCESYLDPIDNRIKFFVRNNDLDKAANIDPSQLTNRPVVGSKPFGISTEIKDNNSLHINIKPTKATAWRRIRAFGLLNSAEILHNGYDVTTRWKNALSKISIPKKEADGTLSFVLSEDNLYNLKPVDKACLLGSISDNKEAIDLIRNSKSLSAYSAKNSVAQESLKSYGRVASAVLNTSILGIPRMFASMAAKGSIAAGFKTLFLDTIKFPRDVLGLKDFPKRVTTLTGFNRFKYVASKLITAPLNLIGGAIIDNKYYEVLLKRECRKDLQKISGMLPTNNKKNNTPEKDLEKTKQKQPKLENKQEASEFTISKPQGQKTQPESKAAVPKKDLRQEGQKKSDSEGKEQYSKIAITKLDKKTELGPTVKIVTGHAHNPESQMPSKNNPYNPPSGLQDKPDKEEKEQIKRRIHGAIKVLPESARGGVSTTSLDMLDKTLSELGDKLSTGSTAKFDTNKEQVDKISTADIDSIAHNIAKMQEVQDTLMQTPIPSASTRIKKTARQNR